MSRDPPNGTVTFVFSDIESSTKLLERVGGGYAGLLETQRRLLRTAFTTYNGYEVDTSGAAFYVAFQTANDAAAAALELEPAISLGERGAAPPGSHALDPGGLPSRFTA